MNGTTGLEFDLQTLLDNRRPSMEDDFWRKMTFNVRHPLMEDDHRFQSQLIIVSGASLLNFMQYFS